MMMTRLNSGLQYTEDEFSALDIHFSKTLMGMVGTSDKALQWLLRILSAESQRGNSSIPLKQGFSIIDTSQSREFFSFDTLRQSLDNCALVGDGKTVTPIVVDNEGYCYLHRLWEAQEFLVKQIVFRSMPSVQLQNGQEANDVAEQALQTVRQFGFSAITGGPGTGKTTLVSRILASLIQDAPTIKIVVCAPTGKAAARLKQAIRQSKRNPDIVKAFSSQILEHIPDDVVTVHKLLMPYRRRRARQSYEETLLPVDVLVVDEASMVDMALMSDLFSVVPATAKIILVGDQHQLSSIEAGRFFKDVCRVQSDIQAATTNVRNNIVTLTHSYRFGKDSGIGRLAQAVNSGAVSESMSVLMDNTADDVRWIDTAKRDSLNQLIEMGKELYLPYWHAIDVEEKIALFDRGRVLCAVNRGPFGVTRLNTQLANALQVSTGMVPGNSAYYENRALLITRNNYASMLFNGDTGMVFQSEEGAIHVAFSSGQQGVRLVPISMLGEYQDALSMTIHKSQGSEYGHAVIVLGSRVSPILSRELLYTAVTRAQKRVTLFATEEVIRYCIEHSSERSSSLQERLKYYFTC
ncbi:MAG: exodeoxyribonuclease V subunit alpha [Deltaproteobacteria bacterium]|nr:exodeoxyribonuclease V subunit alpha [Deltaproteobacteria bacterium]MBN2672428.1 exodeoxyribonuclease V subunit alpha [Deltaproteobacteria bacterium]